ncbi:MAG: hypothetical protein H7Z15_10455 [Rhizobacter sp.]|nr:hypothetical protein [Rhizobacter sp.]
MTTTAQARKTSAPAKAAQAAKTLQPPAAKRASVGAKKPAPPAKKTPAAQNGSAALHKGKPKLVRDSFTIPKSEYLVLEVLKVRAVKLTRPAKKSELLRAGIQALSQMTDKAFLAALDSVPSLKTGRPKGVKLPKDSTPPSR